MKIMTTLVAIEQMPLETEITVDEHVLKAYGSGIYIEVGEVMSLKDLLFGLMLRSGNDAAIAIAYGVAGSMESFVSLMNQKAYEIGMSHTKFYNSHGLEDEKGVGNTSTAFDMAKLMYTAMQNETFRMITGTKNYVSKSNKKTYHWTNKNKLLFQYEYAIGGKTGYTHLAKRTLVSAAKKDGGEIAIVTFNDGNDFQDHQNLYEVLFSQYHLVEVLKKDDFTIPDFHYYDDSLYLLQDVSVLVTKEEERLLNVKYEMEEKEEYETGDVVGHAHIFLKDEELKSVAIYVKKNVAQKKEGFFSKLFRWLFGW